MPIPPSETSNVPVPHPDYHQCPCLRALTGQQEPLLHTNRQRSGATRETSELEDDNNLAGERVDFMVDFTTTAIVNGQYSSENALVSACPTFE